MREPFIFLRSEVTREHAHNLIRWLQDDEVKRYLNESGDIAESIAQAIGSVSLSVLTHLFARNGRFYMICRGDHTPVGFMRLNMRGDEAEMVIVIGERKYWGRKLGYSAIRECMRIAFFELRSKKLVANIHKGNERSIRAFESARFRLECETRSCKRFAITIDEYLRLSREGVFTPDIICVTQSDCLRLKSLITGYGEAGKDQSIDDLREEIDRAKIVGTEQIDDDIVTMRSKAVLLLNGHKHELSLVYPDEADNPRQKLSVLSPVGTAILGYSEGDTVTWRTPDGETSIRIEKVLYQPEAAGDYHL